ncbi:MAG: M20/M25/M40 family metallo-hydrolase [Acidobacteriota bacterium]|nr:M20/M25/M40 family metallo-hydrolase [Acidobacteriota bacterium]
MKLLVLFVLLSPFHVYSGDAVEAARQWRKQHGPRILREYAELLSIPNVAGDHVNIRRNAETIAAQLAERGVQTELWELPGASPVVYGELKVPGATRTLLLYVHYDGQPADPKNWKHDPWTPTLYSRAMEDGGQVIPLPKDGQEIDPEWRLYARASGDDKVPFPCLFAALDALKHAGIALTSNLKFFFEGEEERGSTHLKDYLTKYRDRLDGDLWLFLDGPMHQSRNPQVMFGVRGVTGLEVTVYGASRSLHSGHYGNWSPVPGTLLANLLASMKDENGKILVDGFYDTVAPLEPAEKKALAAVPNYDVQMRRELGLAATEADNASYMERLLLPSLTVKGLHSGNVGKLARNVIPATATASLGVRLVKGNDPEHMVDLVEAHIRKQGYHIVREEPDHAARLKYAKLAKVTRRKGYPAARTSMNHPVAQQVAAAMRKASEDELYMIPGLGGSLPLYLFTDILNQQAIIVPCANHDNNQHAPNENIRIANIWYGIDMYASILAMP